MSIARSLLVLLALVGVAVVGLANAPVDAEGRNCERVLRGSAGKDRLVGCARGERIKGRAGRDVLVGRGGKDRITAGKGRDRINARDRRRDVIRCGPGRDRVKADPIDVVRNCERVLVRQCSVDAAALSTVGCRVASADTGAASDPRALWGDSIDCQTASRHQRLTGGADPHRTATGSAQGDQAFRRLTVRDGDDYWGERCEIGQNENRYGSPGRKGTFALFRERAHRLTFASLRLPTGFPLDADRWQVVMQMKQAQPSANGGGTPVLALEAYGGRWRLYQSTSAGPSGDTRELWSTPASIDQWTRFAFDIRYSQKASRGSIRVYVDLNGDGDALDVGEQSPKIDTYTLKREISGGGSDGIAPGESIPSHLRAGIYHDESIACPVGCSVDVDNVQILR